MMRVPWQALHDTLPQTRLLDSVAEFTVHRDIDALDHSLVLSLAELVQARSVALFKRTDETDNALEMIALCVPDEDNKLTVESIGMPVVESYAADLDAVIVDLEPRSLDGCDGLHTLIVPVQREQRAIGALVIQADRNLDDLLPLVEGFGRIYANYTALINESERDKLTGLFNRRTFEQRLQRLLKRQRQQRARAVADIAAGAERRIDGALGKVWLAILDIDHFKRINDNFGHVYGDEVILLLAQMMRSSFRQTDVLFRFGGEEFVVLLGSLDEATACAALQRFRERVASHLFPQVGHVTVSIGYANIGENDYPEIVLDRADKALYFAKQNGRNCLHGYEALAASGALAPTSAGSIDLF
jgi:diguanylate cyclase (GGDEF)-like protein